MQPKYDSSARVVPSDLALSYTVRGGHLCKNEHVKGHDTLLSVILIGLTAFLKSM